MGGLTLKCVFNWSNYEINKAINNLIVAVVLLAFLKVQVGGFFFCFKSKKKRKSVLTEMWEFVIVN